MEIKKVKSPIYKNIIDGYEKVDVYVTSDGKEFPEYRKNEGERHEHRLNYEKKLSKIKKVTIESNFDMTPSEWFYVSSENELEFLVCLKEDRYRKVEVYGELKVGEWIGCYVYDGGDSGDTNMYYTLSYLALEAYDFLTDVMSKTNLIISDGREKMIDDWNKIK